jgi:hypothetical protein
MTIPAPIRWILRGVLVKKTKSATMDYIKYPKGIKSFSPALTDEIRLRWVANDKLKSTRNGLNQIARDMMQPRCG